MEFAALGMALLAERHALVCLMLIGVGLAIVVDGMTLAIDSLLLKYTAVITSGLALIGIGAALLAGRQPLTGGAVILLGVAIIGTAPGLAGLQTGLYGHHRERRGGYHHRDRLALRTPGTHRGDGHRRRNCDHMVRVDGDTGPSPVGRFNRQGPVGMTATGASDDRACGYLHAQTPPSCTCRVVSNVECRRSDENLIDLHSCLLVHEQRHGHHQTYSREADPSSARVTMERKSVTTDFAWWRLRASVPVPLIGLIVGLPPAAAVGLVAAVTPGLGIGLGLGIMTGLTVGAIIKFIGNRSNTCARPSSRSAMSIAPETTPRIPPPSTVRPSV